VEVTAAISALLCKKMQQQGSNGPAVAPQHTKPSLKAISATNAAVLAQQKSIVGSPPPSQPTPHSKKSSSLSATSAASAPSYSSRSQSKAAAEAQPLILYDSDEVAEDNNSEYDERESKRESNSSKKRGISLVKGVVKKRGRPPKISKVGNK